MNIYFRIINFIIVFILIILLGVIIDDYYFSNKDEKDYSVINSNFFNTGNNLINIRDDKNIVKKLKNGDQYVLAQDWFGAISEYKGVLDIEPDSIEALFKLGKVYIIIDDLKSAYDVLDIMKSKYPNRPETAILETKLDFKKNNFVHAKEVLENIIVNNDKNSMLEYYLAITYICLGEHNKARKILADISKPNEEMYKKAKSLYDVYKKTDIYADKSHAFLNTWLAKELILNYELDPARYLLKNTIKEVLDYRDAWTYLAVSYILDKNYDEALVSLQRAINIDPTDFTAIFYLAEVFFYQGRYEDAIGAYNKALELGYPQKQLINDKLARAYILTGQYDLAKMIYTKYMIKEENQKYLTAEMYAKPIWLMLYKIKDIDLALQFAYLALDNIDNAITNNNVGWVLIEKGDLDKAEFYLNKAKSLDNSLPQIYLNFGDLYKKKGDIQTANLNYKICFDLDKSKEIGQECLKRIINK